MHPGDPGVCGPVSAVRVIRSDPSQVGRDDFVRVFPELPNPPKITFGDETPPMQLPSLLLAHGRLVSGSQPVPCAEGRSRGTRLRKRTFRRRLHARSGSIDLEALSAAGRTHMIAASAPFASCGLT